MRIPAAVLFVGILTASGALAADGIAWHQGDPKSAFELARREGRPLFLYWGATWCPPCNQIKKTIFTRREFIERTRLFVPVYLDGDTEAAQLWSEKLDVTGYPTMLVLAADGRELMRLPTGLQVHEFVEVLDEALDRAMPIADVFAAALEAEPGSVPDRSFRLLAFHAWAQERRLDLSPARREAAFRELARRVPDRLATERSRLFALWLDAAASLAEHHRTEGTGPFSLSRQDRREADRRLRAILGSPVQTLSNLEFLTYSAAKVIPLVQPREGSGRRKLMQAWLDGLERIGADETLSVDERLSALLPAIDLDELARDEGTESGEALRRTVLSRVAWADAAATDAPTRQAVMSTAGYLLKRVGLRDEARALYTAELARSESPYYFMSSLAGMAESDGNAEEAVRWLGRAYEASKGRATRVQWGTSYLSGLLRLVPEETERIRDESLRVLDELSRMDDAFAGRSQGRIEGVAKQYREWNSTPGREATLAGLRAVLLPGCADVDAEPLEQVEGPTSLRERCTAFVERLGVTAVASAE